MKKHRHELILFLLAFACFANTLNHDFAWDDEIVILQNTTVQKGLKGIPDLFIKKHSERLEDQYGYRPVTLLSFALNYEFSKLKPKPYHWTNVLLYSLLLSLLFRALILAFGKKHEKVFFWALVIFAVHPLHSEVVANIKSRDEILQMLFSTIGFLLILISQRKKHQKVIWIGASVLFYILAMLSRENAICLIILSLLYLLFQKENNSKRRILYLAVFSSLIIAFSLITIEAFNSSLGVAETRAESFYREDPILGNVFFGIKDKGEVFSNSLVLISRYLQKFFYPVDLSYHSGFSSISILHGPHPLVILSVVLITSSIILALRHQAGHPLILTGLLIFYVCIAPFLHLARILADTMADRFMFAPSLGICILLGLFFQYLFEFLKNRLNSKLAYLVLLIFPIFLFAKSWERNKAWRDSYTLITSDMPKLEENSKANYFYANEILKKNNSSITVKTAIQHLEQSLDIYPRNYFSLFRLVELYNNQGQAIKAKNLLIYGVSQFSHQSDPHFFLGQHYWLVEKKSDSAIYHLSKAIEIDSAMIDTRLMIASIAFNSKRFDLSLESANRGLKIQAGNLELINIKTQSLVALNKKEQAIEFIKQQIEFYPQQSKLWKILIGTLQSLNKEQEATDYYRLAIQRGVL